MNKYLHPDLEPLLELPTQERILNRWPSIFINLDVVRRVNAALENIARQPNQERQMNLLIYGVSGVGKSSALDYFVENCLLEAKRTNPVLNGGYANIPAFRVSVPVLDQAMFYVRILEALGRKDRRTRQLYQLSSDAVQLMQYCGVQLPIFDEFHNSAPEETGIRTFAATLKDIGATLKRPLVLAGTERALRIVENDPELCTRCTVVEMHRFETADTAFLEMLYSFETLIPLRKTSGLYENQMAKRIFYLSEGLIGNVSTLLKDAAKIAADTGEERITISILNSLDFAKTQKRRFGLKKQQV